MSKVQKKSRQIAGDWMIDLSYPRTLLVGDKVIVKDGDGRGTPTNAIIFRIKTGDSRNILYGCRDAEGAEYFITEHEIERRL